MNGDYFFHPSWPIFYRDNHLLVVYKPAGLLVQADETEEISLLELGKLWIKDVYKKPGRVFLGMFTVLTDRLPESLFSAALQRPPQGSASNSARELPKNII